MAAGGIQAEAAAETSRSASQIEKRKRPSQAGAFFCSGETSLKRTTAGFGDPPALGRAMLRQMSTTINVLTPTQNLAEETRPNARIIVHLADA